MKIDTYVGYVTFSCVLAACGTGGGGEGSFHDAGERIDARLTPPDGAPNPDALTPPSDAAMPPADAAGPPPDLAPPPDGRTPRDAAPDALPDAAVPPTPDAAAPSPDAALPPPDAMPDAFVPAPDAAPPGPDACAPTPELCDGLDNNCNGLVDEDVPAPLGDRQAGLCAGATRLCQGVAGFVEPDYSLRPGYEAVEVSCDGLDNDCDGIADVGLAPPPATYAVGLCAGLTQICGGELGWLDPDPGPLPGYEFEELSCDGLDNDCDGLTDEDLPIVPAFVQSGVCAGSVQICAGGAGMVEPDYTLIPGYELEETLCDGLDNDCDGLTDEGLTPLLSAQQQGVCRGTVQLCAGAAGFVEPDYAAVLPRYEAVEVSCDGLDNNCDGQTDEGLVPPPAGLTAGVCAGQVQRCDGANGFVDPDYAAVAHYEAVEVSCDGLDNDCNGAVDDGLMPPPAQHILGVCHGLERLCHGVDGFVEPDYAAVRGFEAVEASCDGLDNDCNGLVDDGLPPPPADRTDGVCVGQVQACAAERGWVEPVYTGILGYEGIELSCDGQDNDCDGVVDGLGAAGVSTDRQVTVDPARSTSPRLASDGLGHGLVFLDGRGGSDALWFARLDRDGLPLEPEHRITDVGALPGEPDIAFSGRDFAIVYRDTRGGARGELWLTRVGADGVKIGADQRLVQLPANLASLGAPRIVSAGDGYAVVFTIGPDITGRSSVNLLRLDAEGVPVGPATVVSGLPNLVVPAAPAVAFNGTEYGIAWHDARAGNVEIYFAHADVNGVKIGAADVRVTNAARTSANAQIAWNGQSWGLDWSDARDGFLEIYFARVTPAGVKLGPDQMLTNTRVADNLQSLRSALLALPTGDFLVASADTRGDATNAEIYVSRLGPDAVRIGVETRITHAAGLSTLPTLDATDETLGLAFADTRSGNAEIFFARNPFGCGN